MAETCDHNIDLWQRSTEKTEQWGRNRGAEQKITGKNCSEN
jgi:hypothetical protein